MSFAPEHILEFTNPIFKRGGMCRGDIISFYLLWEEDASPRFPLLTCSFRFPKVVKVVQTSYLQKNRYFFAAYEVAFCENVTISTVLSLSFKVVPTLLFEKN